MAESDNILTKLQDLLVYLIPQLNKFPRDQKFVLGDRIENNCWMCRRIVCGPTTAGTSVGICWRPICNWKWHGIWCGWPMPSNSLGKR